MELGNSSRVGQVRESGRRIRRAGTEVTEQKAGETQEKEEKERPEIKKYPNL